MSSCGEEQFCVDGTDKAASKVSCGETMISINEDFLLIGDGTMTLTVGCGRILT